MQFGIFIYDGGGVTLCIDTTLHLIAGMLGQHVSDETAHHGISTGLARQS